MKNKIIHIFKKNKDILLSWPACVLYYFLLRMAFGINNKIVFGIALLMIILRISFEEIALAFFIISLIVYIIGTTTEANYYMSFVFGFLVFSAIKYFIIIIRQRFTGNKKYEKSS